MVDGRILWQWKFLKITAEGLEVAVFMAIRLVLLLMGSSMLTLCTRPLALTDGIERLLSPFKKIGLPAHDISHDDDYSSEIHTDSFGRSG